MDAALEIVVTLGQFADQELTALKDAGARDSDVLKAVRTFGNGRLSVVEAVDEATTEVLNLCESVRLASLVGYNDWRAFLDPENVRFKVPARIGSALTSLTE